MSPSVDSQQRSECIAWSKASDHPTPDSIYARGMSAKAVELYYDSFVRHHETAEDRRAAYGRWLDHIA